MRMEQDQALRIAERVAAAMAKCVRPRVRTPVGGKASPETMMCGMACTARGALHAGIK